MFLKDVAPDKTAEDVIIFFNGGNGMLGEIFSGVGMILPWMKKNWKIIFHRGDYQWHFHQVIDKVAYYIRSTMACNNLLLSCRHFVIIDTNQFFGYIITS